MIKLCLTGHVLLLDEAIAELNCNLSFFYYYDGLYLFWDSILGTGVNFND